MTDGFGRRSTDVEIAELTGALRDLTEDVRDLKRDMRTELFPRIKDLEDWRVALAATELERERNRRAEETNVINKRQFWTGLAGLAFTMIATASGLAALVISHT